jgi:hypothetical protein
MDKKDELYQIRNEIKNLTRQANTQPAAIRVQGIDMEIQKLKDRERELLKIMSFEEIHGAEIMAQQAAERSAMENMLKSKKTLVIAGSVAGFILVASIIGAVIYKKSKK